MQKRLWASAMLVIMMADSWAAVALGLTPMMGFSIAKITSTGVQSSPPDSNPSTTFFKDSPSGESWAVNFYFSFSNLDS
jgi:hypothetical protein